MIHNWHGRLAEVPDTDHADEIRVACDVDVDSPIKRFASMTHQEYYELLRDSIDTHPSYYEIVRGTTPHRLFIDIDGMVDKELTRRQAITYLNPYMTAISRTVRQYVPTYQITQDHFDIFIYTSSHDTKLSFHLIIDVVIGDIKKTSEVVMSIVQEYLKSRRRRDPSAVCDIDTKIYNRNRVFRSIYSRKIGNPVERVKVPFAAYRYPVKRGSKVELEPTVEEYIMKSVIQPLNIDAPVVSRSIKRTEPVREKRGRLIDRYIQNIHVIYSIDDKIPQMKTIIQRTEKDNQMISEYLNDHSDDLYQRYREFALSMNMDVMNLRSTSDRLMILNRNGPSFCACCDKHHDSDNAYISLSFRGNIVAYYSCYRGGLSIRIPM